MPDGPLAANGDLGVVLGGEPGTALGPPGGKPGGLPGALGVYLYLQLCFHQVTNPNSSYLVHVALFRQKRFLGMVSSLNIDFCQNVV